MPFSFPITKSRTSILSAIVLGLMALFVIRLFYIQVIRHDYYVEQAAGEQIKQFTLHAKRGEIYTLDNGSPTKLVMNETVYTAVSYTHLDVYKRQI